MTRIRRAFAFLFPLVMLPVAAAGIPAGSIAAGNPSIRITNLHNGDVVTGNAVTVQVSVSDFKLVPPVYIHPPKLTGNQGHIHYVLDSLANFKPRRDATVALSHTWTGVTPGTHTVEAYLATSQHAQFASAQPVKVSITVKAGGTTPAATGQPTTTEPTVTSAPKSGGASGARRAAYPSGLASIGLIAIVLGMLLLALSLRRRVRRESV